MGSAHASSTNAASAKANSTNGSTTNGSTTNVGATSGGTTNVGTTSGSTTSGSSENGGAKNSSTENGGATHGSTKNHGTASSIEDSAGMVTGTGEPVAALTGPLLAACEQVVAGLLAEEPQTIVVVGAGARSWRHSSEEWGTLAGFGVAVEAPSAHPDTPPDLPLSLTIGRWLLERAGWSGSVVLQEVGATASVTDCLELGHSLDQQAGPEAVWLVVGDGSNRRGVRSPGFEDPRAAAFDAEVGKALTGVDPEALAAIDPVLADELGCVGRAPWQVVAGALDQAGSATATLRYEGAPFGVAYLVADWRFRA